MAQPPEKRGADLSLGTPLASLADGAMVSGHVGDDEVVLARSGNEYFAVGARCTHYKGRLARGLDGRRHRSLSAPPRVFQPAHRRSHSARRHSIPFRAGVLRSPATSVFVREKLSGAPSAAPLSSPPASMLIIGGGAAGSAAADMIRREGYRRTPHDCQRRRGSSRRSTESLEGLSRRRRAGRLAADLVEGTVR